MLYLHVCCLLDEQLLSIATNEVHSHIYKQLSLKGNYTNFPSFTLLSFSSLQFDAIEVMMKDHCTSPLTSGLETKITLKRKIKKICFPEEINI